jgi:hypothetical protein
MPFDYSCTVFAYTVISLLWRLTGAIYEVLSICVPVDVVLLVDVSQHPFKLWLDSCSRVPKRGSSRDKIRKLGSLEKNGLQIEQTSLRYIS